MGFLFSKQTHQFPPNTAASIVSTLKMAMRLSMKAFLSLFWWILICLKHGKTSLHLWCLLFCVYISSALGLEMRFSAPCAAHTTKSNYMLSPFNSNNTLINALCFYEARLSLPLICSALTSQRSIKEWKSVCFLNYNGVFTFNPGIWS